MQKTKGHTLIVRGISKAQKNSLKRLAMSKPVKTSVNYVMLQLIYDKTEKEIEVFELNKQSKSKSND